MSVDVMWSSSLHMPSIEGSWVTNWPSLAVGCKGALSVAWQSSQTPLIHLRWLPPISIIGSFTMTYPQLEMSEPWWLWPLRLLPFQGRMRVPFWSQSLPRASHSGEDSHESTSEKFQCFPHTCASSGKARMVDPIGSQWRCQQEG